MRLKSLLLIGLVLVILTISAVSAEDNTTLSADESLGVCEVTDTLQSSKTFADVRNAINSAEYNGTIELDGYYEGDGAPISISNPITVYGNNAVLDGKFSSRIMTVGSDEVFLYDITFVNGNSSGNGGAINGGTLINCTFINCSCGESGGAIYGGSAINCTFIDCLAGNGLGNSESRHNGGAIAQGTAENCTFINCRAEHYGGAIVFWNIPTGLLYNSIFIGCSCGEDGGAISGANAINCTFTDCLAGNGLSKSGNNPDGGAINNGWAKNCNFTNCRAGKFGGAIQNGDATNCIFINCICGDDKDTPREMEDGSTHVYEGTGDGGAIHNGDATNCRFEKCHTENYGGAIDTGSAYNCVFIKCSSRKDGGGISKGDAEKCTFIDCYTISDGASVDRGNAKNCEFINSYALKYGGAVNKGNAVNCNFVNCTALTGGGSVRGSATNCNFTNSYSGKDGGAMYDGIARNCNFINCKAERYGGGIYCGSAVNCDFTNCHAKVGGAICAPINNVPDQVTSGKCEAYNCAFTKCSADMYGGALYEASYDSACTFKKNSAPEGNDLWLKKYNNVKIQASNRNVLYTYNSPYSIKVYGYDGKIAPYTKVKVYMNGNYFTTVKTNKNGVAEFKVTQTPGQYKVTLKSLNRVVTKDLNVKHFMSLNKVTVKKSAAKLVLTAKLIRKYTGKKITFKFNGVKYTAKTKSGVASITIKKSVLKKLEVGKKITYQATYLGDTVKYTVKVKS